MSINISLCMIVKDEEQTLNKCLLSVQDIIDELIIVDTGSTDTTKEIAKSFNAMIYDFKWCDDFSMARNFAFSKATKDYILWLDADDFITDENIKKLKYLKENINPNIDIVTMHYALTYNSENNDDIFFSIKRNRLIKKSPDFKWIGKIHEYLDVFGTFEHSDIVIHHGKIKERTLRNLNIFRDMQKRKEIFSDRDLFYFANELYDNQIYEEAIIEYEKFLARKSGWVEDRKSATLKLISCYTVTNQNEKKINTILQSFEFDIPRADICCNLALIFMEKKQYEQAIFWYKVAMNCIPSKNNLGLDAKSYYTWIPSIQMCVCYSYLGDYETAYYYNELTNLYTPNSDKVIHNRKYLSEKLKETNTEIPIFDKSLINRKQRI